MQVITMVYESGDNLSMPRLCVLLMIVVLAMGAIHVRKGRLVDDLGAELLFHGLNVVSKVPPYHTMFNETDMQLFQAMGINGIRLGVMWPGVEPRKGEFNETYLQLMRDTVDLAGTYGIYTLVEFHQDLFSEKFCADGVPVWAIPHQISKDFPRPASLKKFQFDQRGFPHYQDCSKHPWAEYYVSDAVNKGFSAIWNNHHGMRDLFVRYWRKVAATFKGSPYVIAYELMNEPWPGDLYRDPLVMVPGLSEVINMQPAYDIISAAIRQEDPDHSICFQPVTWLNYFRAGFSHPPGGRKFANHSIFCYHYYNPPTFNLDKFMKARMGDVKRLGTGGLLSQFYVINAEGEKNVDMMDQCDKNLQSWFGWIYPIQHANRPRQFQSQDNLADILYDESGTPNSVLVNAITRTYAQRVAGETISQRFDSVSRRFSLNYNICLQCGETIIFVSEERVYTKGFDVTCYPRGKVSCKRDGEFYIKVIGSGIEDGAQVMVTILPL